MNLQTPTRAKILDGKTVEIPVCCCAHFYADFAAACQALDFLPEQLVAAHTAFVCTVFLWGFGWICVSWRLAQVRAFAAPSNAVQGCVAWVGGFGGVQTRLSTAVGERLAAFRANGFAAVCYGARQAANAAADRRWTKVWRLRSVCDCGTNGAPNLLRIIIKYCHCIDG